MKYINGGGISISSWEWFEFGCTEPMKFFKESKAQTIKVVQGYDEYLEFGGIQVFGIPFNDTKINLKIESIS